MLNVKRFVFNPISVNCYVLSDSGTRQAVCVDFGASSEAEAARLFDFAAREELAFTHLLNTHGHFDHVWGNARFYEHTGLRPEMSATDQPLYADLRGQLRLFLGLGADATTAPLGPALVDGQRIKVGHYQLEVLATPGHTPGGVCFYCASEHLLLSGDTLFYESVGRTDFPGGDEDDLVRSVRQRLLVLPDDVRVLPGHGTATTIGREKQYNPVA